MIRSIGAVLAGYLPFGISAVLLFKLTGREPHGPAPLDFMILSTLYGMAFADLAGYVAARVAGRQPVGHATAVTAIIASGALVSLVLKPTGVSIWSQLAALIMMAPCALAGVVIRRRLTGG